MPKGVMYLIFGCIFCAAGLATAIIGFGQTKAAGGGVFGLIVFLTSILYELLPEQSAKYIISTIFFSLGIWCILKYRKLSQNDRIVKRIT